MTQQDPQTPAPGAPAVKHRQRRVSIIWLVPFIAVVIGLSMLVQAWLSAGPEITVIFQSAAGLESGKTPVKYKDITVGTVKSVQLTPDGNQVEATLSLDKTASTLARKDTRFWVVRPRVGIGGVSGIDTLLSGAYIGADRGESTETSTTFVGLENPPTVIHGMKGTSYTLHAEDLGSLDIGSPVYYRRIQVGRVASYQLNPDGRTVDLQIFVDAPYDKLVTVNTRFWNASGVDLSLSAEGLKLDTQSMATVLAGGIAFATRPGPGSKEPAPEQTAFDLEKDQQAALRPPEGPSKYVQLRFEQPLRGLAVGAAVEFSGLNIGRVVSTRLEYDAAKSNFPWVVGIVIYPNRLGSVLEQIPKYSDDEEEQASRVVGIMVRHGLRAQARTSNLLTGQLYIALDFVPNAPKVDYDENARPLTVPTIAGNFDKLQEQAASIMSKIEKMPLDSIARHLDATLVSLDKAINNVNRQVLPATTQTLQQARRTLDMANGVLADDAPAQQNLQQTLQDVQRAARSIRTLTDMLGRHPEALLKGVPDDSGVLPANQTKKENR